MLFLGLLCRLMLGPFFLMRFGSHGMIRFSVYKRRALERTMYGMQSMRLRVLVSSFLLESCSRVSFPLMATKERLMGVLPFLAHPKSRCLSLLIKIPPVNTRTFFLPSVLLPAGFRFCPKFVHWFSRFMLKQGRPVTPTFMMSMTIFCMTCLKLQASSVTSLSFLPLTFKMSHWLMPLCPMPSTSINGLTLC